MKLLKAALSLVLVMTLLCLCATPALAVTTSGIAWQDKLSEDLVAEIADVGDDTPIAVWIWYHDIDQDKVDLLTEQTTGLTVEDCQVIDELPPAQTLSAAALDNVTAQAQLDAYMDRTANARAQESLLTQEYVSSRREVANELYHQTSDALLSSIEVPKDDVIFKSEFAPMIIANLTADEIAKAAQNPDVEEVGLYYEESDNYVVECTDTAIASEEASGIDYQDHARYQKEYLGLNEVYSKLNLTGEGVNVGLVEVNIPGPVPTNYSDEDLENGIPDDVEIEDVEYDYNNVTIIETPNTTITPSKNTISTAHSHPSNTVRVMAGEHTGIAKNINIYATNLNLTNIETMLKSEYNINILEVNVSYLIFDRNHSVNPSVPNPGYAYTNYDKYYDHLVAFHHVVLVVAGGNHGKYATDTYIEKYDEEGKDVSYWEVGPRVTSPAMAYNAITVGGCSVTKGNNTYYTSLKNYSWANAYEGMYGCEKPDVIMPCNYCGQGTSVASPSMTAVIALMLELKPSLVNNPQAVKAIVLASCHRKAGQTSAQGGQEYMTDGITERQGAGIPDAWIMATIILQGTYYSGILNGSSVSVDLELMNSYGNYDMNFSLTWLKGNKVNNHYSWSGITDNPISNLDLKVTNNNVEYESCLEYSSTEMCYLPMSNSSPNYNIIITNGDTSQLVRYAYAWSTSDRDKELHHVDVTGAAAVGKTLSATAYCNDGTTAPTSAVDFQWKCSSDGTAWQMISGATASTYTLTANDALKYIRCDVTPKSASVMSGTVKTGMPATRVVIYGDADLDGSVTIFDATHIQRYLSQIIETFTEENKLAADVDGDGKVTIFDVTLIQRYLIAYIDHFPVEE